ncbi:hypothetical protein NVP1251O_13 [Vibrio phage 1.251.O._10N.261.55.E5]|nr:hypothetical protein NVP1251O_13 [Vibrio phage 1.251.O._10N.261.55.E5]
MGKKFKIIRENIGVDGNNDDYLKSFECEDTNGNRVNIDALAIDAFPELDDYTQDEIVDWSRKQLGKYLFTQELYACEYRASGKTYIC